jgi:hypothetical protein
MSHAWLYTGPPSSGRSNAARAFAAVLQCGSGGCGKCTACRTSLSGSHPDVTLVRTELLSIGVDEVRELVRRSAMSPTLPSARPWDGAMASQRSGRQRVARLHSGGAIPLPSWQGHETAQRLRAGCDRWRPPLAFGECGTLRTLVATSPQVAMVGSQEERRVAK